MKKVIVLLAIFLGISIPVWAETLPLQAIKLPKGFKIEVFAEGLANARSMTVSPAGNVFVGTRTDGRVYALKVNYDDENQPKVEKVYTLASGLFSPNGVAFKDGSLYVAEINKVWRFDDIENHLEKPLKPVLISKDFPSDTWHGWKFIRFGPDGKLYIPVGAPCNVCEQPDLRYASIMRMDPNGKNLEIYAKGIRNTVGFDWDPATSELWFTDNGRDNLGDDLPPDELNHAPKQGMHFGFPYCHGTNIKDPEFGKYPCERFEKPAQDLGPHVAALGIRFYTGSQFPAKYHHQIFLAEHGSWNRSSKIGYRVSLLELKDQQVVSYKTFAEGWKVGERVWGRPVDLEILPDGSLLVSDDQAGVIYRISYK